VRHSEQRLAQSACFAETSVLRSVLRIVRIVRRKKHGLVNSLVLTNRLQSSLLVADKGMRGYRRTRPFPRNSRPGASALSRAVPSRAGCFACCFASCPPCSRIPVPPLRDVMHIKNAEVGRIPAPASVPRGFVPKNKIHAVQMRDGARAPFPSP
jgi:hypothetical protein